jgi:hypothetical protein
MRMIFRFTVLAIFCSLFLLQTTATAQPPGGKSESSKTTTRTEIEFPDIDGWEKGEIQKFPTAALGYSIGYQSNYGDIITIYVYNGGQTKIPNDINDKILKNEIEKAKNDIIQAGKAGYYENVKEIKNDTVTLGGADGKIKALHTLFNFKLRGQDVDSEIYLFGYRNNFIKIRATRPKAEKNTENKFLTSFLAEIEKVFSE